MGKLANQAVYNHKNHHSCSAAVLCAFREAAGLSEPEAQRKAAPLAGGHTGGVCGAVAAAEYVLKQVYGNNADAKVSEFEKRFISNGKGSIMCSELKGKCRVCVTDAALILEDMLSSEEA